MLHLASSSSGNRAEREVQESGWVGGYLLVDLLKDILGVQMTGLWAHGHCRVMDSTLFGNQVRVLHSLLVFICLISSWDCFSNRFLKKDLFTFMYVNVLPESV